MTDKEIEQALQDMAVTTNWGSVERIGATNSDVNGVPKNIAIIQETLAYIEHLKAENAELKEDVDERDFILDIFNQREYRKKFIKEVWEGEMGETLSTPDADFIYKLYFEERAKNEYLQAEIERIKHNWEVGKSVQRTKIRKETAKEIFDYIIKSGVIDVAPNTIRMYFKEKYDVEVGK